MDEKLLRRISKINKFALVVACLITFFVAIQIPETFLTNRKERFSQVVKNHPNEDELRKEALSLLEMIDYTQSQSRGIFRILLIFNLFVIVIFGVNLFILRKALKGKPEIL